MLALPHETISNAYQTIRLNRKIAVDYIRIFMTKPFKGTELFEYGRKNCLLDDRAFSDRSYEDLSNIYFKTDYEREFKNLRYLFYIIVKFSAIESLFRFLIKLPFGRIYKFLFFITTAVQEKQFFRMRFFKGVSLGLSIAKGSGKHF